MNRESGKTKHVISLQKAIDLTTRYRSNRKKILAVGVSEDTLCLSETFSREIFENILNTKGCTGIRIYYGMDEKLCIHAVLVGVNEKNEDILPTQTTAALTAATAKVQQAVPIGEDSVRCPNICPPSSPLNAQ